MFDHLTPTQARQVLAQIRPLLDELIPLLGQPFGDIEQDNSQNELSYYELIGEIQAFGIANIINMADEQYISRDQLQIILNALQFTAESLKIMLQDCGHDISLTNQEIFSRVFASQEINFRYDPRNEASIASLLELSPDTFRHIIDFDDSAFDLGGDNLSEERRRVLSENVIIHELGHVFHNALGVAEGFYADGESATATLEGEIPFNAQDVYEQISVTVKQNTPQVIIDFWQATNSYWSNLDFGFGREAGVFTEIDSRNDPTIVPLTKSIYRTYIGIPRENSEESCSQCPENTLVYITGTGGECFRGNDNTCITINNATQYNVSPIYIRDPAFTYRPNYAEDTVDSLQVEDREGNPFTFSNLYRNETRNIDPSPLEGFADTFLTYVRSSGGSNTFPEDEPRRQFFDENLCRWLSSLIEG